MKKATKELDRIKDEKSETRLKRAGSPSSEVPGIMLGKMMMTMLVVGW